MNPTPEFSSFFSVACPVIAMIHVQALPGTPANTLSLPEIMDQAIAEAEIYAGEGVEAIMLENMHDVPYLNREVGHEISTAMAVIAHAVRRKAQLPCGLQILAGANHAALAAAHAAGLEFIRAEGFAFGHVADEGWMNADAGALLRYRKQLDAARICVLTDIKKKHSAHTITADVDLVETAQAAAFMRSDGLIVTGSATGAEAAPSELQQLRGTTTLPILVGSGLTVDNLATYLPLCDGMIVGSHFKEEGRWQAAPDAQRVRRFMQKMETLRQGA